VCARVRAAVPTRSVPPPPPAAQALAEHFGARIRGTYPRSADPVGASGGAPTVDGSAGCTPLSPYKAFVAEVGNADQARKTVCVRACVCVRVFVCMQTACCVYAHAYLCHLVSWKLAFTRQCTLAHWARR
jgi:hypothetical protein